MEASQDGVEGVEATYVRLPLVSCTFGRPVAGFTALCVTFIFLCFGNSGSAFSVNRIDSFLFRGSRGD